MRTNGSAQELEALRMRGGQLLLEGKGPREVARIIGVSSGTTDRWKKALKKGGLEALKFKPHLGPKPKMNQRQKKSLEKLLLAGSVKAGYQTELWTCGRVKELIQDRFGISYHHDHVWKVLHSLGWSCQKPERRAKERDEKAITSWRKKEWPRIKKSP